MVFWGALKILRTLGESTKSKQKYSIKGQQCDQRKQVERWMYKIVNFMCKIVNVEYKEVHERMESVITMKIPHVYLHKLKRTPESSTSYKWRNRYILIWLLNVPDQEKHIDIK